MTLTIKCLLQHLALCCVEHGPLQLPQILKQRSGPKIKQKPNCAVSVSLSSVLRNELSLSQIALSNFSLLKTFPL